MRLYVIYLYVYMYTIDLYIANRTHYVQYFVSFLYEMREFMFVRLVAVEMYIHTHSLHLSHGPHTRKTRNFKEQPINTLVQMTNVSQANTHTHQKQEESISDFGFTINIRTDLAFIRVDTRIGIGKKRNPKRMGEA